MVDAPLRNQRAVRPQRQSALQIYLEVLTEHDGGSVNRPVGWSIPLETTESWSAPKSEMALAQPNVVQKLVWVDVHGVSDCGYGTHMRDQVVCLNACNCCTRYSRRLGKLLLRPQPLHTRYAYSSRQYFGLSRSDRDTAMTHPW